MKMIRATAKRNERRDQRIESVLAKFPSLLVPHEFVDWTFSGKDPRTYDDGDETRIDIKVHDETIVERLASELKACGCVVKIYTPEQFDMLPEA